MTDFKLTATIREERLNTLRAKGLIPAVIYGNNYQSQKLALDKLAFIKLFKEAGSSNLVDLSIDKDSSIKTLIHEVQFSPVHSDILHVDFFKVNMKEKIHAEIPLKFIGDSIAVIEQEGTLIIAKDSIEVECLPGDLLSEIEVDISVLDDFEKDIRVSDLILPAGIEVLSDSEEVVVHIEAPRSDEELAELEAEVVEDVAAIEVENKGEEVVAEGEDEDGGKQAESAEIEKKIEKKEE